MVSNMNIYTVTLLQYSTSKDTITEPITRVFKTYELAHQYVVEKYRDLQFELSASYYNSNNNDDQVLEAELVSNTKSVQSPFYGEYEVHWKAFIKSQTL